MIPVRRYDAPGVKVGRRFMRMLIAELQVFFKQKYNVGHFIIFHTVILKRARHVSGAQATRQRIGKRLDTWKVGQYQILI